MPAPAAPDYPKAWQFLQRFHQNRQFVITGISLDKKSLPTETFGPDDDAKFLKWVAACAGTPCNLYFGVNEPVSRLTKKAEETDIRAVHWLHTDIDPEDGKDLEAERARILELLRNPPNGVPLPTLILFSGGGLQAFWALTEPIVVNGERSAIDDAKRYNTWIRDSFGCADNVQNLDRIMRLPDSLNLPDAKKRAKGRTEALASVVEWHESRVYSLDQFKQADPMPKGVAVDAVTATARDFADSSVDALGNGVSDRLKVLIVNGMNPDDPNHFPSRSEAVLYAACELVRSGADDETILGVLLNPAWKISESVREQKNPDRYARRQVERAREAVATAAAEREAEFDTDDNGVPYKTPHNVRVSLIKQSVKVEWDEFADRNYIHGLPGFGPHLDDAAIIRLRINALEKFNLAVAKETFHDIVCDFARANRRHPVREYLESVDGTWDGTPRVDSWLIDFAGAEDSVYTRAVSRLVLVAAVRRIRQPGCKFDEMPVLEGAQGGGKSSLLATLCPSEEWFTDDLPLDGDAKRFIEAVKGKWIVEAGELKGMRKSEAGALKSMLSRRRDRARMAYGREPLDLPRQCVIFGSTNEDRYLKDTTGNRRYWPIRCGVLKVAALAGVRDQVWAEAVHREAEGESIRLDPALYPKAAEAQGERQEVDPFVELLEPVLGDAVGKIPTQAVWRFLGKHEAGQRSQEDMRRLGGVMRSLGWERKQVRFGEKGVKVYAYLRGTEVERMKALTIGIQDGAACAMEESNEEDGHGAF
ncbi:MAG: VapE domain-containing protein [Phycisphaerales bacterium JB050]